MKKLLAILLLLCSPAVAQNYLRDDGIFHSVVEGTTTGQCLSNSGGLLAGTSCGGRTVLTADRTYYVRTDGSDTLCNGQTDASSASAPNCGFQTIAKSTNVAASLDMSTFQLTIQIDAATWPTPVVLPHVLVGALAPILTGVGSTTIISTLTSAINNSSGSIWQVQNMKITTTSGSQSDGLVANNNSTIRFQGIEFGPVTGFHLNAGSYSAIGNTGTYTISGGAQGHILVNSATVGIGLFAATPVTISGTPAFSLAFAFANRLGFIICGQGSSSWSGSATGTRYSASLNSVIDTAGGGANAFPGNAPGTTATGGQYN